MAARKKDEDRAPDQPDLTADDGQEVEALPAEPEEDAEEPAATDPSAELDGDDPAEAGAPRDAQKGYDTAGDMSPETMRGDIRDAILDHIRKAPATWEKMSEQEQRDYAAAANILAGNIVRNAVRAVSDYGFPSAPVHLGEVKIVGGDKARVEAKIVAHNEPEIRDVLGGHVNRHAMLICVDSETFHGARAEPKIDPDQPDLPMEGEDEDRPVMDGSGAAIAAAEAVAAE